MTNLDLQPNVPVWYRIAVTIRNRIQRQTYKPGDLVPPELELASEFAVSRTTMRRSLDELVRQGLLVRMRGRGTFVSDQPALQPLECLGLLEDMLLLFAGTEQGNLHRTLLSPAPDIADALQIKADEPVHRIDRLRLQNGKPYALTRNYLPEPVGAQVELSEFEQLRLLEILSLRLGYDLTSASETIRAMVADTELGNVLEVEPGFPVLHIRLLMFEQERQPVALTDLFFRGDMYEHHIRLAGLGR
jgi:DNA-binding GntR family transcriptional regulator